MVFYRQRALNWENFDSSVVPRNVWLGCSIGEKSRRPRLDQLRQIPAKVRFVSFEPLIEDLGRVNLTGIRWVIIGGESGANPRPMNPEWAASLIGQAHTQGAAVFFKQQGGVGGNGAGGDIIGGRQYHEFPRY